MKLPINIGLEKMWELFLSIYETDDCRVCGKKIRCNSTQFIKKSGKIKCNHCERYLEAIKEK